MRCREPEVMPLLLLSTKLDRQASGQDHKRESQASGTQPIIRWQPCQQMFSRHSLLLSTFLLHLACETGHSYGLPGPTWDLSLSMRSAERRRDV